MNTLHPNCFNPKCLKKTQCEKCRNYKTTKKVVTTKLVKATKEKKPSRKKTNRTCLVCSTPFYESPVLIAKGHGLTCSLTCRRKLKNKTCPVCKNKFRTTNKNLMVCSEECNKKKASDRQKAKLAKIAEKRVKFRSKAKFGELKDGQVNWEDKVLTLKNYKEPLTKIDGGYGWYGTIACTIDGSQIQCHICGKLVESLPGHINNTHKLKTREYKEKFGLAYGSALVSEKIRMREKQRTLNFLKTLSEEEKKEYYKKCGDRLKQFRHKRGNFQPKKTLEAMNKDASCPDQTLDQIKQVKERIGHVPSKEEFIDEMGGQRYVHLAYKHFGSWNKAIEMCNFNPDDDHRKENMINREGGKRKYTDEELLEYLRIYAQENRQVPTITDFKRGLLPDYSRYTERFGTIEAARRLAGVYDFIDPADDPEFHKEKSKYWRKNKKPVFKSLLG